LRRWDLVGRLDHVTSLVLDLERAGRVAKVSQMAELLVRELHLSKG